MGNGPNRPSLHPPTLLTLRLLARHQTHPCGYVRAYWHER